MDSGGAIVFSARKMPDVTALNTVAPERKNLIHDERS
jgi:hypothetical protein